jgi:hypothetical protein
MEGYAFWKDYVNFGKHLERRSLRPDFLANASLPFRAAIDVFG